MYISPVLGHSLQLEVNESLAGSNEWIQPSFALTPQAVFAFSETQGCYLEKLLRNKDLPPGRRGFHVFETPLSSIFSLQVGWGSEGRREVWVTSAPKCREHPLHAAVSGLSKQTDCLHVFLLLLNCSGEKH